MIERNKQAMAELRRECAANQRQNKPDEHTTDEDEDETTRRCERLPRTDVFGAVDVVRGFPARLCGLRSEEEEEEDANAPSSSATRRAEEEERVHVRARGEEGGCELVVLKEVLIHLTVEDILVLAASLSQGPARAPPGSCPAFAVQPLQALSCPDLGHAATDMSRHDAADVGNSAADTDMGHTFPTMGS